MEKLKHTKGPFSWSQALDRNCWVLNQDNEDLITILEHSFDRHNRRRHVASFEPNRDNRALVSLCDTAPHFCSDPQCPGDINRRKLEVYDALECSNANKGETIQGMNKDILRMYKKLQAAEKMARALTIISNERPDRFARDLWKLAQAALTAWENAGKEER